MKWIDVNYISREEIQKDIEENPNLENFTRLKVNYLEEIFICDSQELVQGVSIGDPCIALSNGEFDISTAMILPETPINSNAYSAGKTVGSSQGTSYTPLQFYKIR